MVRVGKKTWYKLIEEEGMTVGQSREEDMEEADRGRRHEGWSEQGRRHGRS